MRIIEYGDIFSFNTNAGLLNELLGTHYREWTEPYILLDVGEMLWMPRLDGVARMGWKSSMSKGKIIEKYVGGNPYPSDIELGLKVQYRAVFEKIAEAGYYIFRGVYELDPNSTLTHRIMGMISSEITL